QVLRRCPAATPPGGLVRRTKLNEARRLISRGPPQCAGVRSYAQFAAGDPAAEGPTAAFSQRFSERIKVGMPIAFSGGDALSGPTSGRPCYVYVGVVLRRWRGRGGYRGSWTRARNSNPCGNPNAGAPVHYTVSTCRYH